MLEIPRRISLSSQIAAAIRKGIEDGIWEGSLPGERRLCELFQASRPTIHAALRARASLRHLVTSRTHPSRSRIPSASRYVTRWSRSA